MCFLWRARGLDAPAVGSGGQPTGLRTIRVHTKAVAVATFSDSVIPRMALVRLKAAVAVAIPAAAAAAAAVVVVVVVVAPGDSL